MIGAIKRVQSASKEMTPAIAWHRWLQPLAGVMSSAPPPFDRAALLAAISAHAAAHKTDARAQLLAVLRDQLTITKHALEQQFYAQNDGAIYVGMQAWSIDLILQILHDQGLPALQRRWRYCAGRGWRLWAW